MGLTPSAGFISRLESTVRVKIATITSNVEDAVVRLPADAVQTKELADNSELSSVIRILFNWLVAKAFQTSAIHVLFEETVLKYIAKRHIYEAFAILTIYAPAFTILIDIFVKDEAQKCYLV